MTIRMFQALIHIESPTLATSKLVANIDPNLPLIPQSLLDFLMKRLCGVLLSKLQSAARKIGKDPVTNAHAVKQREEKDFYQGWLLPKFLGICKVRGWEMPPISAFELSEAQIDFANALTEKKKRKHEKQAVKLYHSMTEDNLEGFLNRSESQNSADSAPANIGRQFNNSGGRGPKVRTFSADSDDVSELSRNSSSTSSLWRNNPISVYLSEIEERTQLQKAKELEKSRQKAADRLKPRELDEESRSRLEELRIARGRRVSAMNTTVASTEASTEDVRSRSISVDRNETPVVAAANKTVDKDRDWAVFWTKHGPITKSFVMLTLMSLLFFLLYFDSQFNNLVSSQEGSFWMARGRDVATLVYMGIAGWVHFVLCYVSLMYAFSALQIGSIAGKQAKKFYSENVHLAVGVASASMVGLGVIKSGLARLFEYTVWGVYSRYHQVKELLPELPEVPALIEKPLSLLIYAVSSGASWTEKIVFESNVIGRKLLSTYGLLSSFVHYCIHRWTSFVDYSVGIYDGSVESVPWRQEAFIASRALFCYSATFLLVLLFLFNLSAKHARNKEEPRTKEVKTTHNDTTKNETNNEGTSDSTSTSTISSSSQRKVRMRSLTRSLSPGFDTIDEDEVFVDSKPTASSGGGTGVASTKSSGGITGVNRKSSLKSSKASLNSM